LSVLLSHIDTSQCKTSNLYLDLIEQLRSVDVCVLSLIVATVSDCCRYGYNKVPLAEMTLKPQQPY